MSVPPGSVVVPDWLKSPEGKEHLAAILRKNKRKVFGIQTTVVYWPAKQGESGRAVIFRLQFWDCGEAALRKFDHILPACREKADAILFLFSFTDRSSFDDLPAQISRVVGDAGSLIRIVVGTKFDQFMHADVTERDVAEFQRTWHLPVFRAQSAAGPRQVGRRTPDAGTGLWEVAPLLNGLAEHLWHQDQVAAGLIPAPLPSPKETGPC
ncbi:REM2- and Rab-like small GTPase 1 isoform X2 [Alligator sinensis]|uniref:Ciliogenesis and planar polarity effector 2 n=1 Tax=Alligator sinensis TaxID=38654 RepID=A0A1U8D1M1_ALLSI|nr:REM2- and Rab-like small GTPase 1 isoform X2 [Alligator sinensis]